MKKYQVIVMNGKSVIEGCSLGEVYKLCPTERFRAQPTAGHCSGTLVATDLIMTERVTAAR